MQEQTLSLWLLLSVAAPTYWSCWEPHSCSAPAMACGAGSGRGILQPAGREEKALTIPELPPIMGIRTEVCLQLAAISVFLTKSTEPDYGDEEEAP